METQSPIEKAHEEFLPGTSVIYAMHGKCHVLGTETRNLGGEIIRFYKLEVKKIGLSRTQRQEPAIWVPVSTARNKGLRLPMDRETAQGALDLLLSRESFFSVHQPWSTLQATLENTIRHEGGPGLAKVASFLLALKRFQVVTSPEVNKLCDTVNKLLLRELSEALLIPIRDLEVKMAKSAKNKVIRET